MELHELNPGDDIGSNIQTRPTHSLQLWKNSITTLKVNHT
ncbi:capsid protein [Staphylococcus warneri]